MYVAQKPTSAQPSARRSAATRLERGSTAKRAAGFRSHYGGGYGGGAGMFVGQLPSSETSTSRNVKESSLYSSFRGLPPEGLVQSAADAHEQATEVDRIRDGLATHPNRAVSHFLACIDAEHVNMRHRGAGVEACVAIAACLPHNRCIVSIDLANNPLGDEGGATLFKSLLRNSAVRVLDLSSCGLGPRSATAFAAVLSEGDAPLTEVRLADNPLGDAFFKAVGPEMAVSSTLQSLDLSSCSITGASVPALAAGLEGASLAALNLAWNDIGAAATGLFDALQPVSNGGNAAGDGAGTTDEYGARLASAGEGSKLTTLNLAFNGLADTAGVALARALRHDKCTLTDVDVSNNRLSAASGAAVAAALKQNRSLRALRIGFNPLGATASVSLAKALQYHTGLVELSMENSTCGGTDRGVPGDEQVQRVWEAAARSVEKRGTFARFCVEQPAKARKLRPEDCKEQPVIIKKKVTWSLRKSIFAPRLRECDTKDFYDTPELLYAAFRADWEHSKLPRVIKNPDALADVKEIMAERYPLLRETFRFYAGISLTDPFSMGFQSFSEFRRDVDIEDPEKNADLDNAFIAANFEVVADPNNPDHSLVRYEFIEAVVRLSLVMYPPDPYVPGGEARAVRTVCDSHILPTMSAMLGIQSADQIYSNDFRKNRMYNEPVDKALRSVEDELMMVYDRYSGRYSAPGEKKHFVSLDEWVEMCNDARLITPTFPERDAKLAFVWSNMTTVDEAERTKSEMRRDHHSVLTWVEFLEALCRLADSPAFVPDEDGGAAPPPITDDTSGAGDAPAETKPSTSRPGSSLSGPPPEFAAVGESAADHALGQAIGGDELFAFKLSTERATDTEAAGASPSVGVMRSGNHADAPLHEKVKALALQIYRRTGAGAKRKKGRLSPSSRGGKNSRRR